MYFVSMQTETAAGSRILIKIDFALRTRPEVIRNCEIIPEFCDTYLFSDLGLNHLCKLVTIDVQNNFV